MFGGVELAKVLFYYGFIDSTTQVVQKIVCPFHEDINPSMIIDLDGGTYYCFGCHERGNALDFIKAIEKVNDLIAYRFLLRIMKSNKTKDIRQVKTKRYKGDSKQLTDNAYDYYFGLNKINWKKETDKEKLKQIEYMVKRGYSKKILTKTGCRYNYNSSYPLIFPMFDNDEFKGWVCRTTDKEIEQKRKYLYNKGFSRANTISGTYDNDYICYVCEGHLDMLKLKMFGVRNACAILGWKATDNQIQKLKDKGITHIISALDNDKCGKKGTAYLQKFFTVTPFCYLKGIKDAGDMNKESFRVMNKRTLKHYKENLQHGGIIKENKTRVSKNRR